MKMYEVLSLRGVYDKIKSNKMSIKTLYKLNKIFEACEKEFEFYQKEFNKILEEYGKKDENGHFKNIGDDFATLRAFTKDEIILFLNYSGFELLEITPKQSYAWKDDFYIARKI